MKTTIDIPENAMRDAMRFSKAKTKREAILTAVDEYIRRRRVEALIAQAGSFPDFPSNEEIEAPDREREEDLRKLWTREDAS